MSIKLIEIKHVAVRKQGMGFSKDIQCTFEVDGKKRRIRSSSKNMTVAGDLWCNGMGINAPHTGTYALVNMAGVGTIRLRVGDTYHGFETVESP